MAQRNQRLESTITVGSVLQKSVKKNFNVIRAGLDSVGDEIKRVTDRQKELSKQRKVLERQGRSVDHLDREYEELGRTLDSLKRKQERFARAQKAANRVGQNFGNMTREVGRLARTATVAVGATGAAVFKLAGDTAELGDNVAKTADKLGFGIEGLQELRYAAERSGVSVETFDSSMVAMQKRLGEAVQGKGAAKDALEQIGLSAEKLIEMKPEDALAAIAEKIEDIENPSVRAQVAANLFSRAGVGMVNMLRQGSEGMQELREEARKTGYRLSEKTARQAEVFQDRLLDAQLVVKGLKNTIGAELMPVVTDVMTDFSDYMRTNRDGVQRFAETFATGVGDAIPIMRNLVTGLTKVGAKVFVATGAVADFVGGWENLGLVVGALVAGKAIASVLKFVGSVVRLGGAVARLAPVLPQIAAGLAAIGAAPTAAITATIGVVAGGAWLIYKNWGGFNAWWGDLFGSLGDVIVGFGRVVGGVLTGDLPASLNGLKRAWRGVGDFFSTVWRGIGATFRATWTDLIKPVLDALGATEPIVAAWQSLKAGLGEVLTWIGEKFSTVYEKIEPVVDALKWVVNKGGEAVSAVGSVIANDNNSPTGSDAPGAGWSGGSDTDASDLVLPEAGPVQSRAVGGSFRRGPLELGERGPERVWANRSGYVENNRALERAARVARQAREDLSRGAGRAAAPVTQHITINAQQLTAEQVIDEIDRRRRQAQAGALFDGAADYGQYGEGR